MQMFLDTQLQDIFSSMLNIQQFNVPLIAGSIWGRPSKDYMVGTPQNEQIFHRFCGLTQKLPFICAGLVTTSVLIIA